MTHMEDPDDGGLELYERREQDRATFVVPGIGCLVSDLGKQVLASGAEVETRISGREITQERHGPKW